MAFVLKIKYGNILRRVNIPLQNWPGKHPNISFTDLQAKVRDLFEIPLTVPLVLTYTDAENDVVTLGDQQDLIDACVVQGLNPLYLTVTTTPITTTSQTTQSNPAPSAPGLATQTTQSNTATSAPGPAMGSAIESVGLAIESVLRGVLTTSGAIDAVNGHLGLMFQPLLKSNNSSKLISDAFERFMKLALKQPQAGSGNGQPPAMARSWSSASTTSSYSVQSGDNRQPRAQHPHESGMKFRSPGSSMSKSSSYRGPQMVRRLDACFVKDVTILDGTKLAPGMQFVKIWRLRNEGTLPWPHKTQLVHVGGALLGSNKVVNLELPTEGLGANKEIEAFIDFVAPMEPGRYASHWRLMSPMGQKFGHRVWVDIQVVPRDELEEEEVQREKSGDNNSEAGYLMVDKETEHNTETEFVLNNTLVTTEVQQDICESEDGEGYDIIEKPLLETLSRSSSFSSSQDLDGDQSSVKVTSTTLETLQEPILGAEEEGTTTTATIEADDVVEATEVTPSVNENLSSDMEILGIVQEACLEQLAYMGFNMKTLNLELLHKNKNNLQQTIQDLSTITQWDPIIKVLEDMGFNDKELNYRLMFKNAGSVKRVVKDLVLIQVPEGRSVKGKEKAQ